MKDFEEEIKLQVKKFEELLKNNTNKHKADPVLLSNLDVSTNYGIQNIKHIASIVGNTDGSRSLRITPFDSSNSAAINTALWKSELGNVTSTNKEIILYLHPVTQEYINKINKEMKEKLEHFKVIIRQKRQDAINELKKEKSEDIRKKEEKKIQEIVDKHIKEIDVLFTKFIAIKG